jgi:hypothetical protein
MLGGRIVGVLDRDECTTTRLGMMVGNGGDSGPI